MDSIQLLLIAFSYDENEGCEEYLNMAIQTYSKLADEPDKLEYIVGINSKGINIEKIRENLDSVNVKFVDIQIKDNETNKFEYQVIQKNNTTNSRCHGDALNELIKHADKRFFMTVDSDCFCLKKGWDTIMKGLLKNNIIVVGSGYHKDLLRYRNFPALFSSMYITEIWKKIGIDFTFDNDERFMRVMNPSNELRKILQIERNDRLTSDTGSKLCYLAKINGYDGIEFKSLRLKHLDSERKFLLDEMLPILKKSPVKNGDGKAEEFQYNGEVFFVHISEGRWRHPKKDIFAMNVIANAKHSIKSRYGIEII